MVCKDPLHILMLCSFTNQVLPQLDLLRCGHEFRPAGVHGWLQAAAIETAVSKQTSSLPQRVTSTSHFGPHEEEKVQSDRWNIGHFDNEIDNFNIITLDHLLKNSAIVGNAGEVITVLPRDVQGFYCCQGWKALSRVNTDVLLL